MVSVANHPLFLTIAHRPYVFCFLISFFILATLHIGILRTLIWLLWGFSVAWISEVSSIRNGFPYGEYHYIYESMQGELILGGVPVWDSLSYTFVAYASYAMAWFLAEPHFSKFKMDPHVSPSRPLKTSLIAALLMMAADIIIDPVSNLGEKWFLGKIYFYPHGGIYFGVPWTNFAGWFLVGLVIIAGFQILEKIIFVRWKLPTWGAKRFSYQALLGPGFYFGIVGFALTMTFLVGAYRLGAASAALAILLLTATLRRAARVLICRGVGI